MQLSPHIRTHNVCIYIYTRIITYNCKDIHTYIHTYIYTHAGIQRDSQTDCEILAIMSFRYGRRVSPIIIDWHCVPISAAFL